MAKKNLYEVAFISKGELDYTWIFAKNKKKMKKELRKKGVNLKKAIWGNPVPKKFMDEALRVANAKI